MWQRLARASIWAKGAIPLEEWKYRRLKQVWLPFNDLVIIAFGIVGAAVSIPALDEVFPPDLVDTLAIVLAGIAAVCLAGVCFPKLWLAEMVGKLGLIGVLASYIAALWVHVGDGSSDRASIAVLLLVVLILPTWRLELLAEEIRDRQLKRRTKRGQRG